MAWAKRSGQRRKSEVSIWVKVNLLQAAWFNNVFLMGKMTFPQLSLLQNEWYLAADTGQYNHYNHYIDILAINITI